MKIAILGATGHVSQCALFELSKYQDNEYYLFSRNEFKLKKIVSKYTSLKNICLNNYDSFNNIFYDVIINGISIGSPSEIDTNTTAIWEITEKYDNIIIEYLKYNKDCLYINFSSGAVYGNDFTKPVINNNSISIDVNKINIGDYYRMAKLGSEFKHRSYSELNIVDIRIFSFFSRFIDLNYNFLMCNIINCIKEKTPLITTKDDILRDYIHIEDFGNLLKRLIEVGKINKSIDLVSKKPISKFEILNYYKESYNLVYKVDDQLLNDSTTGIKSNYYSLRKNDFYIPDNSSLDCIKTETKYLLKETYR